VVSLSIMVVDDSQLAIRKMETMLVALGHKVVQTAANGSVAIDNYRKALPDLVTMDITMPEMSGIEATSKIIAEYPDAKIIMVTSHGQEDMVRQAIKACARGYVMKPVEADALAMHIDRVINL
jgi:two-component system, chemotaxis family, chemotaxis protein CheY